MTTNLVAREQPLPATATATATPAPQEVVDTARCQSKLLMDIVEKTGCYMKLRDKKYLMVEAWECIGAFNGTHAETESLTPIIEDGQTVGYQAKVQLFKNGAVVGGASMPCFFTENACKGKEKDSHGKHKAAMSAAQTFATSKAYRMNFSYVAILAGYQPTPAEEMSAETVIDNVDDGSHYCRTHKVNFFKRGKMRSYAHQIEDTGKWCNEPESQPDAKLAPVETVGGAEETTEYIVDLKWLEEQLVYLQSKHLKDWSNAEVVTRVADLTGTRSASVSDAVALLTSSQAKTFITAVKDAVELA